MLFKVKVRETKTHVVEIQNDSAEAALSMAKAGMGRALEFVRSETYAEIISASDGNKPTQPELFEKPNQK